MITARVTGNLFATRKDPALESKRMLVVREQDLKGKCFGPAFIALDRVSAGLDDLVLINKEGSGARLLFGGEKIPVQAVIVAIIDHMEISSDH